MTALRSHEPRLTLLGDDLRCRHAMPILNDGRGASRDGCLRLPPRRLALALIGLMLCAFVPAQAAADRNVRVGLSDMAWDLDGGLRLQGTRMPETSHPVLSLGLQYGKGIVRQEAAVGGATRSLVDDRLEALGAVAIGLGSRGAMVLTMPAVLYQDGDTSGLRDGGSPRLRASGAGPPGLIARIRLLGERGSETQGPPQGWGLAMSAGATLPVGTRDTFYADQAVTTHLGLQASYMLFGLGVVANLAWGHRFVQKDLLDRRFRDDIGYGFGLHMPIPILAGWTAIAEVAGRFDPQAPFKRKHATPLWASLGARAALGAGFHARIGIDIGLVRGVGAPAVGALLQLQWSAPSYDKDGDGIDDANDGCPTIPEDLDGFEDADGCPDLDNDGDLVPDDEDACPMEPAEEGNDTNGDGCPDDRYPLAGGNAGQNDRETKEPKPGEDKSATPGTSRDDDPVFDIDESLL